MAEKYKKQTHREHILSLPDTYIGSVECCKEDTYVVENDKFVFKSIPNFNPGFYKLFDEMVVNAHDHAIRTRMKGTEQPVKNIWIQVSPTSITVKNDGEAIDVDMHTEYGIYIPQLIFGELLTSTNYDKEEKKLVGGKNGYGVKLVNIFAKKLTVEIVDSTRQKKYIQVFENNMTKIHPPKLSTCKTKPYVSVTWEPDFARFGYKELPDEMIQFFRRRASDLSMTLGKEVKVHWNEESPFKCRDIGVYASEYVDTPILHAVLNDRWEIAIADSPDGFLQVSFVNGIWTSKGGTHVDSIVNQVVSHIGTFIEEKKKVKVKPSAIKDNIAVFIRCMIENPSFNSQTKETLTTKSSAFGSSSKIPEDILKKIPTKLSIITTLLDAQKEKDEKDNKKTDGRKKSKIYGIPKLEDAQYAGTAQSPSCTLILTEGDSAKAMALSGLSQAQRTTFGVFPLRGKLMNVKDTGAARVELVKEIADLKEILGLRSGRIYTDVSELRYGKLLIMTDQDYDGSHIRGLVINLFHELWHTLIAIPGFINYMATPIVKATGRGKTLSFYTQYEYEQWRQTNPKGYTIKYYKGLGTSTRTEAQEYFKVPRMIPFRFTDATDDAIGLAFDKSRANDRKTWLLSRDPSAILSHMEALDYDTFVHKDLIHFSYYNLQRSIPNVMDGLKTSQRKILYAAFKRKLTTEIRVAQFAGYVSEHTGYHHGEASLNEAIIGMAQDYMGANNIPWFVPEGQFGTRLDGGKDSASPRYIHTYLQPYIKNLVPEEDFAVLKYNDDDGTPVEPEWYAPVLPMILINGARGIGTGFSTFVPTFNPQDLKSVLMKWLDSGKDEDLLHADLVPWTRGFTGTIVPDGKDYIVRAKYTLTGNTLKLRDLPVGVWTSDFKQTLDKLCVEKQHVKDYVDCSTDAIVSIDITLLEPMTAEQVEKVFGLATKLKLSNMHLFDPAGNISKYESVGEILHTYAKQRLALYATRKEHLLTELRGRLPYHANIVKFLTLDLDLRRKPVAECETILTGAGLARIEDSFDYLLRLPISSYTQEAIARHTRELQSIEQQIAAVDATTPVRWWKDELSAILTTKK
jgi:DNA topoisomerase-2